MAKTDIIPVEISTHLEPDKFCLKCEIILRETSEGKSSGTFARFKSRELLEDEAAKGCRMCTLYLSLLSAEQKEEMRLYKGSIISHYRTDISLDKPRLIVSHELNGHLIPSRGLSLTRYEGI
jgi:hypothetical protein